MSIDYYLPQQPGAFYHIFNRGNNRENIFPKEGNTTYFLDKYAKYIAPVADTYAYCLLPNHFHLMVRIKTEAEILALLSPPSVFLDIPSLQDLGCLKKQMEKEELVNRYLKLKAYDPDNAISILVSEQFRRLFMSYAKAVNKQTGRVGSLFQKNFKRLQIDSAAYLIQALLYVHANPQLHGLCSDFRNWSDCSYSAFLSDRPTKLARTEVLHWFGGTEGFVAAHDQYIDWKMAGRWLIED